MSPILSIIHTITIGTMLNNNGGNNVISKNSTVWQLQQQLQWLHVTGCKVHLLLQMKLLAITI